MGAGADAANMAHRVNIQKIKACKSCGLEVYPLCLHGAYSAEIIDPLLYFVLLLFVFMNLYDPPPPLHHSNFSNILFTSGVTVTFLISHDNITLKCIVFQCYHQLYYKVTIA